MAAQQQQARSPALTRAPTKGTEGQGHGATPPGPLLFDYFTRLAFTVDEANEEFRPVISAQFPEPVPGQQLHKDERALLNSLTKFVFPDLDSFPKRSLKREERFLTFVMTAVSGAKRYGYCMRILPAQSSAAKKGGAGVKRVKENLTRAVTAAEKLWPIAYCVITPHPHAELFEQLLLALVPLDREEEEATSFSAGLVRMLHATHALAVPRPGEALRLNVPLEGGASVTVTARRASEAESAFDSCFVPQLLLALDALTLLHVYLALLLERRVIFVSAKPSIVAHSVLGASALIAPFTWQHVFIPLLPASMLDMVCAPMPFVVGVLESMTAAMSTMPMEEVLFVDLDNQLVIGAHAEADPTLLPPDVFDALLLALQRARSAVVQAYAHEPPSSLRALPPPVPELRSLERELFGFQASLLGAPAWRAAILSAGVGGAHEPPQPPPWGKALVQQLSGSQLFHMFTHDFCERPFTDASDVRVKGFDAFVDKIAAEARLSRSRSRPTLGDTSSIANSSSSSSGGALSPTSTPVTVSAPSAGKVDVVVKTGWLTKQGLKSQSWQLRYFVLTRTHLQYKKSKTDVQPQGVIVLSQVQRVESAPQGSGKEHCFALVTEGRVYLAYAESAAQMQAWLGALRHRVAVLPELMRTYPTLAHEHEHWLAQGTPAANEDDNGQGKDSSVMGNFATIGRSGMKNLLKSFKNNRPVDKERDRDRDRDKDEASPSLARSFSPSPTTTTNNSNSNANANASSAARAIPAPTPVSPVSPVPSSPSASTSPALSPKPTPATPPMSVEAQRARQNTPTSRPKPLPRAPRAAHIVPGATSSGASAEGLGPGTHLAMGTSSSQTQQQGGAQGQQQQGGATGGARPGQRASALFDSLIDEVLTDLLAAEAASAGATDAQGQGQGQAMATPVAEPSLAPESGVSALEVDAFLDAVLNETQQLFASDKTPSPTPTPTPTPVHTSVHVPPPAQPQPRLRAPLTVVSAAPPPPSAHPFPDVRPSRFAPRLSEMMALSSSPFEQSSPSPSLSASFMDVVVEADGAGNAALGSPRLSASSSSSSPSVSPAPSPRLAPRGISEETWRLLWRLGRKEPLPPDPVSDEDEDDEDNAEDEDDEDDEDDRYEARYASHTALTSSSGLAASKSASPFGSVAYQHQDQDQDQDQDEDEGGDVLGALAPSTSQTSPVKGATQRLAVHGVHSRERRHSQVASLLEMYAKKLQQAEHDNALHLQALQGDASANDPKR